MTSFVDKKVILTACVVVAFLLSSSMLILFYNNEEQDNQIRLIGRVNTEGSGIYLKDGEIAEDYVTVTSTGVTYTDAQKAYWGGKIFGTPGTTSIQHMQLQTIVVKSLGLKFAPYSEGTSLDSKTVYYIPSITNAAAFISSVGSIPALVGGIIWEPQFSKLIDENNCVRMMLSSDFEPGHTCCVIGASHRYIENNSDVTVRFLAAYIKSVDAINAAKADRSSAAYEVLLNIAMTQTGISDKTVIADALENVDFTYANTSLPGYESTAPLADLEDAVENLADTYYSLGGVLKYSMSSLGFSSTHTFAQTFVDDGYLAQALKFTPSPSGYSKTTISVAYISGDIHTSLAIGLGTELGYFSDFGIVINASPAANGAGVATSLQNGEADFGFMGAPPILTTVINSKLIEA